MGLLFKMDVVGDLPFLEKTPIFGFVPDYSRGCEVFRQTFLAWANELVPVDTGYLQSTITASYKNNRVYCETYCEYAQYPEYGTWCQPEQPYFRPAIEIALEQAFPQWINAYYEAEMKEVELLKKQQEEMQREAEEMGDLMPVFDFAGLFLLLVLLFIAILTKVFFSNILNTEGNRNNSFNNFGNGVPDIMII